jgi:hypothetical protein
MDIDPMVQAVLADRGRIDELRMGWRWTWSCGRAGERWRDHGTAERSDPGRHGSGQCLSDGRHRSPALGLDGQRVPIEGRLHAAIPIRPIQPGAARLDPGKGLGRRVAVRVDRPDRDDRGPRSHSGQEPARRGGPAAVVGDLQEIDPGQAPGQQDRIDLLLDVTGQQKVLRPECAEQDDRDVVDRGAPVGRFTGNRRAVRPEHLEGNRIELERVAGREHLGAASLLGESGPKCVIRRTRSDHARLEDPADPVAPNEPGQAARVILVRMAEDQDVDAPVPRRNPGIKLDDQAIRIRPAVDQQPPAPVSFDQDRIALANIEDRDVDASVGTCGQAGCQHRHGQGEGRQPDPAEPARPPA